MYLHLTEKQEREREKGCLSFQAESGYNVGFGDTVPREVLSTALGVCLTDGPLLSQ